MLPSTRIALAGGLILTATTAVAAAALLATSATAQSPPLASQPYTLSCWQDGALILSRRETQALQSLNQPFERGLTLESADGSRRILAPLGESLCMLEFTASRS